MNISDLVVGTSSLPGVFPRFVGTKVLDDAQYFGLISNTVSDSVQEYSMTGVKEAIRNAYFWALANDVELWLLPELCLGREGYDYLRSLIDKDQGRLRMVLMGSMYTAGGANQARVWSTASPIANYDKIIPFHMQTDTKSKVPDIQKISREAESLDKHLLQEDFQPGSNVLTLRLGDYIVGIAICRDVLDPFDPRNPLIRYLSKKVDIMLVTSMNSGHTNLFTATAESMARWHGCATFYVNNISSVASSDDKTVEMSFALLPKSDRIDGIQGCVYYRAAPGIMGLEGIEKDAADTTVSNVLNSVVSGDVVVKSLPTDGNALYKIRGGKLLDGENE